MCPKIQLYRWVSQFRASSQKLASQWWDKSTEHHERGVLTYTWPILLYRWGGSTCQLGTKASRQVPSSRLVVNLRLRVLRSHTRLLSHFRSTINQTSWIVCQNCFKGGNIWRKWFSRCYLLAQRQVEPSKSTITNLTANNNNNYRPLHVYNVCIRL